MNFLSYKGYSAVMEYDAEDHIIVGRVSGIKDIIAFHGETVSEFEAAFRASVDHYLLACEKFGKPPAKPASGKLMLRVSPEVHCAALAAAQASGVSLNQWATQALIQAAA
ncbi:MAG: type II toxin-antitoxin system HicB family antitoxin [Zoogloeaceae bacterium]|jgi:predicted HicB family RNase H-like nuclease|nr:type II toxin-antitoxin system HicB family antitoxin [Zoogloeaceae bacterium]